MCSAPEKKVTYFLCTAAAWRIKAGPVQKKSAPRSEPPGEPCAGEPLAEESLAGQLLARQPCLLAPSVQGGAPAKSGKYFGAQVVSRCEVV